MAKKLNDVKNGINASRIYTLSLLYVWILERTTALMKNSFSRGILKPSQNQ